MNSPQSLCVTHAAGNHGEHPRAFPWIVPGEHDDPILDDLMQQRDGEHQVRLELEADLIATRELVSRTTAALHRLTVQNARLAVTNSALANELRALRAVPR